MANQKFRRQRPEVSAGSMADIAFLLLIFFLVTTTIDVDKGILAKLPPWNDDITSIDIPDRNVLSVKINAKNDVLIESKEAKIEQLKTITKEFILNPLNDEDLAVAPNKAVVSLQNDRGTSYETYLQVYNELKAAYNELWNEKAQKDFGKNFEELGKVEQRAIKKAIPLVISEAEPTGFGE